ncbi:MAG: hypothetical protein QOI28_1280 [Mycobacterium sp.]|jgi:hypothetical protein|nr:hypothetical protein [Mycobacterium sp.]MDT5189029.1 hypothetical protein [Mycobacterium sp.]MDT5203339.1 hypothetical protein [Mycobacterium sp.]MDT5285668.1 hypothetical protein [Mycobacterium sp.]MDT5364711.1 hypothetical protein [Mycobacterium sp.]
MHCENDSPNGSSTIRQQVNALGPAVDVDVGESGRRVTYHRLAARLHE